MRIKEGQTLERKDGATVDAVEEMARFARITLASAIYHYLDNADALNEVRRTSGDVRGKLIAALSATVVEQIDHEEDLFFGGGLIAKWEEAIQNES